MSDNLELTAAITTDEPQVAATLDELRYLVFRGMKGDDYVLTEEDKREIADMIEGGSTDAVLYTQQTLTPAQQEQARGNIGAAASATLLSMLIPILRDGLYGTDQTAAITALEVALGGTPEPVNPIETYTPTMSDGYINVTTGATGGTSTYKHTEIIPVREGDKVYGTSWDSNYSMTIPRIRARFTAAYDSNRDIYPAGGVSDQHDYEISTPFVVPSGVYGVVFSIVNSLANQVVVYVDKSERVGA